MAKANKTLSIILGVIDKDVRKIKKTEGMLKAPLPEASALALTRYASTLKSIIESDEDNKKKAKQALERLDTDKLVELYNSKKEKK